MKPSREYATNNQQSYFVTSSTSGRRGLFRDPEWARLFLEVLFHYREKGYLLHEFVLMWDHFHLIITPKASLEKAVQFIKGGFSFKAKQFQFPWELWQRGFSDHRIRDVVDLEVHRNYVHQNPVKASGTAKAVPFQTVDPGSEDNAASFLRADHDGKANAARLQSTDRCVGSEVEGTETVIAKEHNR